MIRIKAKLRLRTSQETVELERMYARGDIAPRYPVPTTLGETVLDGYWSVIFINQADGANWVVAWDGQSGTQLG